VGRIVVLIMLLGACSKPKQVLIDLAPLLLQAKEHDPFACGQGLKGATIQHSDLLPRFVEYCCYPPVPDMAGLVQQYCPKEL
jgi:hypothetical protein